MKENIDLTRGLIFSQSVLLALTKKGISREQAFRLVQRNSLKAWKERLDFKNLMQSDKEIREILSKEEVNSCFSLQPYLEKIDYIFDRVLSDES
jgi:adenylosuccinate lyase